MDDEMSKVVPSEFLREIWDDLNSSCFDDRLTPMRPKPTDIGWLSSEVMGQDDGRCGIYGSVLLNDRYFPCEAVWTAKKTGKSCDPEQLKAGASLLPRLIVVLLHEMVHQATAVTAGRLIPLDHGPRFVVEANRVKPIDPGSPLPLCTLENAARWPMV